MNTTSPGSIFISDILSIDTGMSSFETVFTNDHSPSCLFYTKICLTIAVRQQSDQYKDTFQKI